LVAAYHKVSTPIEFAQSIENYKVFGEKISRLIAIFVPFLEISVGLFLLLGIWLNETLILTVLLYFIFDVMILQAYFRDLDISCGCFGVSDESTIGFRKFGENLFLTFLSIYGYFQFKIKSQHEKLKLF
jgi:uncharacterized membrane protein YphA (DoxX/SURF4 family)